jgi:hypothetical protein
VIKQVHVPSSTVRDLDPPSVPTLCVVGTTAWHGRINGMDRMDAIAERLAILLILNIPSNLCFRTNRRCPVVM